MALADIISKIAADGRAEAAALVSDAESKAAAVRERAEQAAAEDREHVLASARRDAEREASRIRVSARLAARDDTLVRRRELLGEVLASAAEKLSALPDDKYAHLLAVRIAAVARGGEKLLFGAKDTGRAEAVLAELARIEPGLTLSAADTPAPFDRGALVEGDRVRADLSLESIVAEQQGDLELVASSVLFEKGA